MIFYIRLKYSGVVSYHEWKSTVCELVTLSASSVDIRWRSTLPLVALCSNLCVCMTVDLLFKEKNILKDQKGVSYMVRVILNCRNNLAAEVGFPGCVFWS